MAPPKISNMMTFLIELLAAVPSVIYGLLGIFILVPVLKQSVVPALKSVFGALPIFDGAFYGMSIFSAGIVLSVMIVPFMRLRLAMFEAVVRRFGLGVVFDGVGRTQCFAFQALSAPNKLGDRAGNRLF